MRFLAFLASFLPILALGATAFQFVTPSNISVAGGESQDVSVRFIDAQGRPAAGETAGFSNDACGTFGGGGFFSNRTTDANGVATATFTASNPPGITCWIRVQAGVTATIDVLTYRASEVVPRMTREPAAPRIGEPYTVNVQAGYGGYSLANVDVGLSVIHGTAGATVSASTANTGDGGTAVFTVTPQGQVGDYMLQATFRTQKATLAIAAPASPWQDMWWVGPAEDGWGMSIVQHRDVLFAVIYAYDAAGEPTWYVVPGGSWNAGHTVYSGDVYLPSGTPFQAYEAAKFVVGSAVGTIHLAFDDASHATLDYAISGKSGRKALTRDAFGTSDAPPVADAGDMWWAGVAQNGWGIAILQQGRSLFSVLYSYDAAGAPTWFVMPAGSWTALDTYEGRIYKASGAPWLGAAYDPSKFRTTDVGSFRMKFGAAGVGFDYTIDGRSGSIGLVRDGF